MIYFEHVMKSFGKFRVLNDLNLHIPKGQITFIIGKSGEGKSVTIKHIMGLLHPDLGRIIVDGKDITKLSKEELLHHRQKFGMLFQHAALFDSMTVGENIAFPLNEHTKLSTDAKKARIREVLEQCGLSGMEDVYPTELSTGEKKRVGLARALAAKPLILLYDEPTTGMDPLISEMIDQLIVKVNKDEKNLTSVVISHDLKAALNTADRIIMLYKGQVSLSGTPDDFRSTKDPVVKQFFSGQPHGPMEFL